MSRFALRPAPPRTLPAGVAIVLLMLSGSGFVHAQANADAATTAPPVATSDAQRTTENARRAELEAQAKALRAEAETTYQTAEPDCYRKFLVNRCIDQAKQQRLQTIQRARALEAEAREIDLAQRQRAVAEVRAPQQGATPTPPAAAEALASPLPTPPAAATVTPVPSPEAHIAPTPAAERIRSNRAQTATEAEAAAQDQQATRDAERAVKRAQTEAEAASRAEATARDRARYEERIRKYEEEQATKKK